MLTFVKISLWVSVTVSLLTLLVLPGVGGFSDEFLRSGVASIGVLFLGFLLLILFLSKERMILVFSPISWALFFFGCVIFVSTLFSLSIQQSLFGLAMEVGTAISFVALFFIYLASRISFSSLKLIDFFFIFLSATFLFLAPFVFLTTVLDMQHFVFDTFDFGVLSALVLLLALIQIEFGKGIIYPLVLVIAGVGGVLFGNDRAIQVALWVSLVIIVCSKFYFAQKSKASIGLPYVSGFFVLATSVLFLFPATPLVQGNQAVEVRPSWEATRIVTQSSVLDNPARAVIGTGPNTFSYIWNKYKPEAINATPLWNANFRNGIGGVPTLFVTLGMLGGLLFLFLIGSVLYSGFSHFAKFSNRDDAFYILVASLVGSVYGLIVFTFQIVSISSLALTFVFMGILSGLVGKRIPLLIPGVVRGVLGVFLGLGILFGSFFIVTKVYYVFSFERDLIMFNETGDTEAALAGITCARKYIDHAVCYRFLAELQRTQLQDIFALDEPPSVEVATALTTGMLANAQKAVSINAHDYRNLLVFGNAYTQLSLMGTQDAYGKGIESYDAAIALSPRDPFVLLLKAQLMYYIGKDVEGARRTINESLSLKADYEPAKAFLATLDKKSE